jgi:hypothetical protein
MKHLATVSAALLATTWFGAGMAQAHAADSDAARTTETRPDAGSRANEKDQEKKGELELCKKKAQGLDGPERARFMTDCLSSPGRN